MVATHRQVIDEFLHCFRAELLITSVHAQHSKSDAVVLLMQSDEPRELRAAW